MEVLNIPRLTTSPKTPNFMHKTSINFSHRDTETRAIANCNSLHLKTFFFFLLLLQLTSQDQYFPTTKEATHQFPQNVSILRVIPIQKFR